MSTLSITNDFTAGTAIVASQVNANNTSIETWANGGISDDNFTSTAGMYTAYRTILTASTRIINVTGGAADYLIAVGGSPIAEATDTNALIPVALYLDDADYTITGRTPKLRLRAQAYVNATAPTVTLTMGLFPMSAVAGTAGNLQATLGAVTSGSTVAFASPAGNSRNEGNSSDFAFPADGHYAIGVTLSGAVAANSYVALNAQLQQRWT